MKRVKILLIGMLVVLGMTACGGKQEAVEKSVEASGVATVESKEQEAAAAKEGASEVVVEAKQEVASEPSVEVKEEATSEAVVYEGIDMESTLPWEEWISTFEGIIEEPKYIVVNDETNKKVIVESRQSVEIEEGDFWGIYCPGSYVPRVAMGENDYILYANVASGKKYSVDRIYLEEGSLTTDTVCTPILETEKDFGIEISCTITCENLDWIREEREEPQITETYKYVGDDTYKLVGDEWVKQ